MKKLVPGCAWAHEKMLVGLHTGKAVGLSPALAANHAAAGVDCVVNLLSKDQFRAAGAEALFAPLGDLSNESSSPSRSRVNIVYSFWPAGNAVPTARQVRLTLDEIDEAHAVRLTVLLHGAGVPSRAVIAAACWLAREGRGQSDDADPAIARLGWLGHGQGRIGRKKPRAILNNAQRAFVRDWPGGRNAEPVLGVTELLDEAEPYPTATVVYWLRTLPTVRVYPEGRGGRCLTVPVIDDNRVSNGTINLELCGPARGHVDRRAHAAPARRRGGRLYLAV